MASPRESRRSDYARLIAGACALAALDARADSFGIEAWGIPVAIGMGGPVASFVIPLVHGKSGLPWRLAAGIGLALLDIVIWIALGAASFLAAAAIGIQSFDARAIPLYVALVIWPWILPVILWLRARRATRP